MFPNLITYQIHHHSMKTIAFPSLSRTNLSRKKDIPDAPFFPKLDRSTAPKTVWAEAKPIATREAWMMACEAVQHGTTPFDYQFFWGFKAPLLLESYEKAFRVANRNVTSVKHLGEWLQPITYQERDTTTIVYEEGDDEDEQVVETFHTVTETPQQRLAAVGIKSNHIEPLMAYIAFVTTC